MIDTARDGGRWENGGHLPRLCYFCGPEYGGFGVTRSEVQEGGELTLFNDWKKGLRKGFDFECLPDDVVLVVLKKYTECPHRA